MKFKHSLKLNKAQSDGNEPVTFGKKNFECPDHDRCFHKQAILSQHKFGQKLQSEIVLLIDF